MTISNAMENQTRLKVSVTARLVAALSFIIPAIGGALSSLLLMNVFRALRSSESAGISAVMAGMKEASLPVIVSLYLAALFGIVVIVILVVRIVVQTKTASPPIWFFILGGILSFLPAGLFWKAQLATLDAISPGSSAIGGIGGVAAEISELLLISVIAAPIVFLLLLLVSVLPFRSHAGSKWGSLVLATVIEVLFIGTAAAIPFLIDGPKRKNEIVNLPANVEYADSDSDIEKESSMVLTLTADNRLYDRQKNGAEGPGTIITREELPEKLAQFFETKTPDKRIVYIKADSNTPYENVLQVFDSIRRAEVDKVGLIVIGKKDEDDPYQISPEMFEVRLPAPVDDTDLVKPNPLTLVAALDKEGRLKLNGEGMGTIGDSENLEARLKEVFAEREINGVFREDSNEIEKTIFLKVAKSNKYGDFIKLVQAVRGAGAHPIGIQIDEIN
ncbi:MAG: hypothetical protein DMF62_17375 [Acidobacteria bacterium]|nr:MAG: hypothetical protein DMF62_17375 [Acidobacteriota bacterium]